MQLMGRMLPTDREVLSEAQEQRDEEARALRAITQARALGMARAALVLGMWEGLETSPLSQEEKLQLVVAALRGS